MARGVAAEPGRDGLEAQPEHTPAKPGSISGSGNIGQEQFQMSNPELKREKERNVRLRQREIRRRPCTGRAGKRDFSGMNHGVVYWADRRPCLRRCRGVII